MLAFFFCFVDKSKGEKNVLAAAATGQYLQRAKEETEPIEAAHNEAIKALGDLKKDIQSSVAINLTLGCEIAALFKLGIYTPWPLGLVVLVGGL